MMYFTKFFVVPSIALHYILKSQKINFLYIVALAFAFTGDLLTSANSSLLSIIAIGCFMTYNLLILIIIFEIFGIVDSKKITWLTVPVVLFIGGLIYYFFHNIGGELFVVSTYFIVLGILFSFCLYYSIKEKNTISLYFLIGVTLFFFSNLSKAFEYYESTEVISKILKVSFYSLCHYLYCKAIIKSENSNLKENKSTQSQYSYKQ